MILASAVLIGAGYALWQDVQANLHVPVIFIGLSCYVMAFAFIAIAFLFPDVSEWVAVGGIAYAFLAVAGALVKYKIAYYGTDALLFNAYSARLLLEGIDPYTRGMEAAYGFFNAPQTIVTPTAQGAGVYVQSYPALSFLIYVPFIALHAHNVLWISIAAHVATILLLAWAAPASLRAIAALVLSVTPSYLDYTVGGVTDILWVPAMLLCVRAWNRSPASAAVWLGIACGFKQTPWLIVPFALVFWAQSAWARRNPSAFLVPAALWAITFALPNLPFALWHPQAWLHGITEPMSGGLIAFGSGLIQFTTSQYRDWQPEFYQRLSLGFLGLLVVVYAWQWRRLGFLPFLAPPMVLFLAPRSLQNYFMYWPLVLLVYLFAAKPDVAVIPIAPRARSRWIVASVAAAIAIATTIGVVRAQREHIAVSLGDARINAVSQEIDRLHIRVRNDGPAKSLRFAILLQGQGTYLRLWNRGVPIQIPANATSDVWVSSGSSANELPADGNISVQVLAIDPDSGTQTYSNPQVYINGSRALANADLRRWSERPPYLPLGWSYDARDFTGGVLRRERADFNAGAYALSFRVPKASDASWRVAAISQRINSDIQGFRARLRPSQDYAGDVYPRALFGIELIDALGRHIDYTIDSRLKEPKIYRRDLFTYVVVPGKLNEWNDVTVDLRSFGDQLLLTSSSSVSLSVIVAVHSSYGKGLTGEFGGIYDVKTPVHPTGSF